MVSEEVTERKIKLAVLLSGSGTTLKNIIDHIHDGHVDAEIVLVISSKRDVKGLDYAREAGLKWKCFHRKDYGEEVLKFSDDVFNAMEEAGAELVVLAGFIHYLKIPDGWNVPMINIHPALIPAFCGKGFYGERVHQAVLDYGVKLTGATVHFVDEVYDHGPIIAQETVEVRDDDTPHSLAERVQAKERELYPKVIQLFAGGRVKLDGRKVRILSEES